MTLSPITNDQEHRAALKEVEPIFDNPPELGTQESAHFEALCERIEAYEAIHYPIEPPTPEEAIKFRQEQERGIG